MPHTLWWWRNAPPHARISHHQQSHTYSMQRAMTVIRREAARARARSLFCSKFCVNAGNCHVGELESCTQGAQLSSATPHCTFQIYASGREGYFWTANYFHVPLLAIVLCEQRTTSKSPGDHPSPSAGGEGIIIPPSSHYCRTTKAALDNSLLLISCASAALPPHPKRFIA